MSADRNWAESRGRRAEIGRSARLVLWLLHPVGIGVGIVLAIVIIVNNVL